MAHESVSRGRIYVTQGELLDANINRSPTAYLQNPAAERAKYVISLRHFYTGSHPCVWYHREQMNQAFEAIITLINILFDVKTWIISENSLYKTLITKINYIIFFSRSLSK
jgi:hypothetical protein